MTTKVWHDQQGNVVIDFHGESSIKYSMDDAEKLGRDIKKNAFNARMTRKSLRGKLFSTSLTVAASVCVAIYLLSILFFFVYSDHPGLALAQEAAFTLLFIFLTVISVIFENHIPRLSQVLIVFSVVGSVGVYAWSAYSETNEQQNLAEKLSRIEHCDETDWEKARNQNKVPFCTSATAP